MPDGITPKNFRDLTNETFGRLKVLYRVECPAGKRGGSTWWICECSCGNFTTVRLQSLIAGVTKSCGCIRREKAVEKIASGICQRTVKHGCATRMERPCEYVAWRNARRRYSDVSEFARFYELVGPRPEKPKGARLFRVGKTFQWLSRRKAATPAIAV